MGEGRKKKNEELPLFVPSSMNQRLEKSQPDSAAVFNSE